MTNARQMCAALSQLMAAHSYVPAPSNVALAAPSNQVEMLSGIASTPTIDHERVCFAARCFGWPLPKDVPLLHNHNAARVGTVDELHYASDGSLMCRARVTDPAARRCNAWSVGAKVLAYTLHNTNSANFWAEVTQAALTDISLVQAPINPRALVQHRAPEPPHLAFYTLLQQRVAVIEKLAEVLVTEVVKTCPQT